MNEGKIISTLLDAGIIVFDIQDQDYRLSADQYIKSMPISLGFEDIAIQQKKSICNSRLDVNVASEVIRDVVLDVPMIASNMNTVCNAQFCIELYKNGCLGVLHRFGDTNFLCKEVHSVASVCEFVAASVGVGNKQFELAQKLIQNGANILFIDIAHGYSDDVIKMAQQIKSYSSSTRVVVGNTTNTDMMYEVCGIADAVKVGIAQGFACETKNTAGCTEKQFSAVLKFKHIAKKLGLPIISDGGVREPADLTKAIGAGANSIMAGKIFAACPESAAEVLEIEGKMKKVYAGSASRYIQNRWGNGLKDGTCPEGGVRYLDVGESLSNLVERYSGALKSGITYAGGKDLNSFQKNVEFLRI